MKLESAKIYEKNPPCHHHFTFTSNLTRLPFALCKTVKERTGKKIKLEITKIKKNPLFHFSSQFQQTLIRMFRLPLSVK